MTNVSDPLSIDTDVLVDYLQGRNEAVNYIDNLAHLHLFW